MNPTQFNSQEESLDPADWSELRSLAHRMVDDMITNMETIAERPVWQPIPEEVKHSLDQPLPRQPQGAEAAYQDFLTNILPHPMGNSHPRFWGWVVGTAAPLGVLGELLAATMNPNLGGGDHVANYVEHQVINWIKQLFGFPIESSGLLVSGGSMANLVGLTVARNSVVDFDLRKEGLQECNDRLVCYASVETHSSIQKAVELLGLGGNYLRQLPVNNAFQLDIEALEGTIKADRAAGLRPFLVIGNAGTVNSGAYDDLNKIADICQRESLWFHVDGAFGAAAAISPTLKPLVSGMERADSMIFDLHKWLYTPFEAGCVLVRNEAAHRQAFSLTPDYLEHTASGLAAGAPWFSDYGVQLSRGFRALKVWLMFKAYGTEKLSRQIQQNADQARYLEKRVVQTPELELLAPVSLNIVCFRYKTADLDDKALNALNRALLVQLHESGVAAPSYTTLDGKYALRVCIINHRTRREDLDLLVEEVVRLGKNVQT